MTPKRRDVGSLPEEPSRARWLRSEDDHKRMRDLISENDRLEKNILNLTGKNLELEKALRHACLKIQLSVHQVKEARKETRLWATRMLDKLDRMN